MRLLEVFPRIFAISFMVQQIFFFYAKVRNLVFGQNAIAKLKKYSLFGFCQRNGHAD